MHREDARDRGESKKNNEISKINHLVLQSLMAIR